MDRLVTNYSISYRAGADRVAGGIKIKPGYWWGGTRNLGEPPFPYFRV